MRRGILEQPQNKELGTNASVQMLFLQHSNYITCLQTESDIWVAKKLKDAAPLFWDNRGDTDKRYHGMDYCSLLFIYIRQPHDYQQSGAILKYLLLLLQQQFLFGTFVFHLNSRALLPPIRMLPT